MVATYSRYGPYVQHLFIKDIKFFDILYYFRKIISFTRISFEMTKSFFIAMSYF